MAHCERGWILRMYELIDGEKWEVLPSGNYAISDRGRLMRTTKAMGASAGKILKTFTARGYERCKIKESGQRLTLTIHATVASEFLGPRPDGMIVHHRDHNTLNNCLSNLVYQYPGKTGQKVSCKHYDKSMRGPRGRVYPASVIAVVRESKISPPAAIDHANSCIAGERWEVLRDECYAISSYGRMMRTTPGFNTYPGKLLRPRYIETGYIQFVISGRRHVLAHRMVAEMFIPDADRMMQVNHIDGVKSNNHASNLEYVTALDNVAHAMQSGLFRGAWRQPGGAHKHH